MKCSHLVDLVDVAIHSTIVGCVKKLVTNGGVVKFLKLDRLASIVQKQYIQSHTTPSIVKIALELPMELCWVCLVKT